jgi:RNA polymerase sigma-70 factor (ECF subfamily)
MLTPTPTSGIAFAQDVDDLTLARARRGDRQAIGLLYQRFGRACYNLALRLTGNASAAEDVVQEVFVKLIDAIARYRGDAPFGAWLKRMTANAAIDQLRAQRFRDDDDPEKVLAEVSAVADVAPDADHDLWTLLQRLPARARAVLLLHEVEGYTHRELAELFGQTESYSKSILSRSLQRLQGWLGQTVASTE